MRVLSVVGNRPQFIKAAPVSVALRERAIAEVVVHTGQHYDRELSQVFFDELGLREPDHRLDLRTADAAAMRLALEPLVERERPDAVLVYGDTNSTLAGAEAAGDVPVAHVEAGLRSGDWSMPEERNRVAVDRLAALLLCPDDEARRTLEAEAVAGRVEVVGDVMADVSFRLAPLARERSHVLARFDLTARDYAVATVHREANVQPERLARIVSGLNGIPGRVVFPAHPRTRAALERERLALAENVTVSEPLGYVDFTALCSEARVIVTDSGGLQKEAYWLGVPCVTLRPSTEWVATVAARANVLVDDDPARIVAAAAWARMPTERPALYGDGRAAGRVAEALSTLRAS